MQYLMAFKAFNDHLPPVCGDILHEWFAQLPTGTKGSAVLGPLYSKFNLTIEYYRRRDSLRVSGHHASDLLRHVPFQGRSLSSHKHKHLIALICH
jgi:hypothetical protein